MAQREMAAKIMKCGTSRVWFDPSRMADIDEAITSADIRRLINDGVIHAKPKTGLSNFRKKKKAAQKKKGRMRGKGSFKGHGGTRHNKKQMWMKTIRAIRSMLLELKEKKEIDSKTYRDVYSKSRSGFFRSRAHVMIYLERNNALIKKDAKGVDQHTEKK